MNLVETIDLYAIPCGYCQAGASQAMGMWAHKLSCEAYQDLLDRGWRRSGLWLYRPLPDKQAACKCHPYTIRLDTAAFQPSKDQRKVMRRFQAFLDGRRNKPSPDNTGLSEEGPTQPGSAEAQAGPLSDSAQQREQQWLMDDRKRKLHLISPSPVASPADHQQSLAEEASDASAGAEPSLSMAMSEADWVSVGADMDLGDGQVASHMQRESAPCHACDVSHARGACLELGSGCCTPGDSEQSASSTVAASPLPQPALQWPEQLPGEHRASFKTASPQVPGAAQSLIASVQAIMQQAVHQLIAAGRLPCMHQAALTVKAPTRKQLRKDSPCIVLTSPAAHALAAAARRMPGGSMTTAEDVAEALAAHVAAGLAGLCDAAGSRLVARAEAGHVNFHREDTRSSKAHSSVPGAQPPTLSLASDVRPVCSYSYADAARPAQKGGRAQILPSPPSSPDLPSSLPGQRAGQQWSIAASYAGQTVRAPSGMASLESSEQIAPSSPDHDSVQGRLGADSVSPIECPVLGSRDTRPSVAQMDSLSPWHPGRSRQKQRGTVSSTVHAGSHPEPKAPAATRSFEIRTLPADGDLMAVEFPLFRKYQICHHKENPEEVTEATFRRFLIDTPLTPSLSPGGVRFGSYHQQYWVDGELIAVGVVDVLPRCLSSAYLFWDPALSWLALGKLTALKEIAWVQAAGARCPALRSYHMGYYLETCPKMRYKADFQPSQLLCMHTYAWVPLSLALPGLQQDSHCCIGMIAGAGEVPPESEESGAAGSEGDVLLYCGSQEGKKHLLKLSQLRDNGDSATEEVVALLRARLRAWQRLGGPVTSTCVVMV